MVLSDLHNANLSVMDDSVYIEEGGSGSDVAAALAGADAAKVARAGSAVAAVSDGGATTGTPEAPILEQVDSAEKAASTRNCYILAGIVLLGLAIIGIVLGVTFSGGSSGSSDGAQGAVPSVLAELTFAPIEPADPTFAPVDASVTTSPTTVAPMTFAPVTSAPITPAPVTPAPTTQAPVTAAPVIPTTTQPVTPFPVLPPVGILVPTEPTTDAPIAPIALTAAPVVVTFAPTTAIPTPAPTGIPTPGPTSVVQGIIEQVALQGGAEFDDPTSFQSLSLEWLEGNANIATYTEQKMIQRYVCGCVHFATSGVENVYSNPEETEWMISDGWLTDDDECTWYGLSCDLASATMITEIDLRGNNVTGTFPPEVMLLANSLIKFDIGNNKVWNLNEEVDFLGQLTNLQILDIGNTLFEYDGIPPALGNMVNLVEMDIAYTLFFGPIRGPEVFSNLQKLETLQMGGNAYNQAIPAEIAQLPALTRFYCDNSFIEGNIDFIADMPVIFEFWIDNNPGLGGTLPTSLGDKFQSLQSFSVTECNFSGTIPTEMGNLLQMQLLWLYGNPLSGSVPEVLGTLRNLLVFDISDTMLTGSIPDGICALTSGIDFEYVASDCAEVECCCCKFCTSPTCA